MDPIGYTMIPFSLPHSGTTNCQTPGCSFLADVIPWQVHHGLVDFQCFGMGLRADKDGKPFQAWEFATPCPTPNIWSQEITSRSQCEWVAHLSWWLQMIFQLVGYKHFWMGHPNVVWFKLKQITTYQRCQFQKLTSSSFFILILHQSFATFMCKWCVLVEVVYYCGINDLHFGADVEVPWMHFPNVSPAYAFLTRRVRHHGISVSFLDILRKPHDFVTRILSHFFFGWFVRSWVGYVAAHWRNKGHQRVGYPHSCPMSSNIFWGQPALFWGCSWFDMLVCHWKR